MDRNNQRNICQRKLIESVDCHLNSPVVYAEHIFHT